MILNSATLFIPKRLSSLKTLCLSSTVNTDNLRTQLDQLHSEAQITRNKANNARLRLLRLSEAAEKLRLRAAKNVQAGREDDARELLFQKKKIMQALEKSKSRIELLDELSAKLNEAISAKETQLIGNVSLDLEVGTEETSAPVHVVPANLDLTSNGNCPKDDLGLDEKNDLRLGKDEKSQLCNESEASLEVNSDSANFDRSTNVGSWNDNSTVTSLNGISCYEDFLKHLDSQLENIEAELATILRLSTVILENEEKPRNSKLQKTLDVLEDIRSTRRRIASITLTKV